jgi:hypothetical protein
MVELLPVAATVRYKFATAIHNSKGRRQNLMETRRSRQPLLAAGDYKKEHNYRLRVVGVQFS